ncbi:hypothetical protein [Vibrio gallicus]|uniref:hypothetical protein n=1 Tax=Vibrio gallicus TaxID=190897 RepID=UPI0021C438B9|nr:hypothetical protein [Vibrio gallicus]
MRYNQDFKPVLARKQRWHDYKLGTDYDMLYGKVNGFNYMYTTYNLTELPTLPEELQIIIEAKVEDGSAVWERDFNINFNNNRTDVYGNPSPLPQDADIEASARRYTSLSAKEKFYRKHYQGIEPQA